MAVRIRLRQQGRNNRPAFRVVVADGRSPRDGKYLETLGWYNPFQEENNISVDAERLSHWVKQGAQVSPCVKTLLEKVAPTIAKEIVAKKSAQRTKRAAKRRELKKKG